MASLPSLFLLGLAPPFLAIFGLWGILWLQGEFSRKSPVSKKVGRYPGYTLSCQLESLEERLMLCFLMMILIPVTTVSVVAVQGIDLVPKPGRIFWTGLYLLGASIPILYSYRLAQKIRRTRMGLKGERIVGQKLEKLRAMGFQIFHDVPMDFGNIDHVAVGPPGVFAVETKYRRKRIRAGKEHELRYNGDFLHFPGVKTQKPLHQAKRQALDLEKLLDGIFGSSKVVPLLIYPGWFIIRKVAEAEVHVFNENELEGRMRKAPSVLDEASVRKISSFLEERVRDVEI